MKQDKRADREVRLAQALGLSKSPEEVRSIFLSFQKNFRRLHYST